MAETSKNQTDAIEYLNAIRFIEKKILSKRLEIEALEYKASGAGAIRYDKEKVQTTPSNYMEMACMDLVELKNEVEEDEAGIEDMKGRAYAIVRKMDKPDQRAIIEWYYLNCIDMSDTASRLHMSERNAYSLRDIALESFGIVLNS